MAVAWRQALGITLALTVACSDDGNDTKGTDMSGDSATADDSSGDDSSADGDGSDGDGADGSDAPGEVQVVDESKSPVGIGDEAGFGFTAGEPLDISDADDWKWVGVEGAFCQDKSPTGFFVKKGTVDKLIIYLEGGGACFNQFTCLSNPQTFGETDAARVRATVLEADNADNPFKDWNKVFVGYCSGDIYSGSKKDGTGFEGRTQQGFVNVGLYLERIVPTFADVEKVVLTGSSGGGFGALWNFFRTQEAFDDIRVTLIDDSGPAMGDEYLRPCLQANVRETWGWDQTLPPDCKDCFADDGGGIIAYPEYLLSTFPGHRFGLMSYTGDGTIRQFFGFGANNCMGVPNMSVETFSAGLDDLQSYFSEYENFTTWTAAGEAHTFLINGDLAGLNQGIAMKTWLSGVVDGGDGFRNVGP